MDVGQSKKVAAEWENEARDRLEHPIEARVVLARAVESLVPDDAQTAILTDDDSIPAVGAITGTTLLILSASAAEPSDAVAECRAVTLNAETEISVTHTVRRESGDGLYTRRRWTVAPTHGTPVSFYTALPGLKGPDIPFVQSLARAIGWALPNS